LSNYSDQEIGKVIDLSGDYAILEVKESAACRGCHAKVVCSAGKDGNRCLKLKNTLNAQIGDSVAFETSENQQVAITAMQYGLPLLGFMAGLTGYFYGLADYIQFPKEIGAFMAGIALMIGFGLITRLWSEKKSKTMILHQMKEILSKNEN
jgi:positive regulator of sigma E activity